MNSCTIPSTWHASFFPAPDTASTGSPEAVAEHAVGLLLALVRKLPKAYNRVREHNFNLSGLEGFTINGKVIGILGVCPLPPSRFAMIAQHPCSMISFTSTPPGVQAACGCGPLCPSSRRAWSALALRS